jgi:[ribosomal protein S5]-alanine N-acetyltransferase
MRRYPPVELQGERIALRHLAAADAPALLAFMKENRHFLEQWEPVREKGFFTLDAQAADIEAATADAAADRRHAFGIFLDSELVGRIALSQIFRGIFQNGYLGYSIAERWNGQGLATEAVGLTLDFAFGDLDLHRVQAAVMPRNKGSIRVLEKNGFREEGYAVGYLCINGIWEDHRIFARIREGNQISPTVPLLQGSSERQPGRQSQPS